MANLKDGTRVYGNLIVDGSILSGSLHPAVSTVQNIIITTTSAQYQTGGGTGFANILVTNSAPILYTGMVVTSGSNDQIYISGDPNPGEQRITINTNEYDSQFTVYGFVTTTVGTSFSNVGVGYSGLCLAKGTKITLSDGFYKNIEDITYEDKIKVWDFDKGCFSISQPLWIKKTETANQYNMLSFNDGSILRTIDQHRIFNKEKGCFTYPMTDDTPIGTVTFNHDGKEIVLIQKEKIEEEIDYYNVITDTHVNLFANSILTSCRFNNIYPIIDMKFQKDSRKLRSREEFKNISDRFFYGLRLSEQRYDLESIENYIDRLIKLENIIS